MARIVAKNAALGLDDNTGTCRALSGRANSITLTMSGEAPEVTGFTEVTRQRLAGGLLDWELTADIFFDAAANQTDLVLSGLMGGSGTRFIFGPAGSTSGCNAYTACAVLTEYGKSFGVADAGTATLSLTARSGSLTATTFG